ncbi:D-glycero-beta-D-manno-heptose 1,7-bisphosphate 7-phosphatase [Sulfuriflexus mobilis]|uniref:D-glycero-beta-D-manno-heptose 1,7-bisphosphate 7-phosphatase n=1 Tax=Sulfuriflexus mobilis TaxID=1811807 RepID=UPI000F834D3A|nr:D-glycero-beta-D-manno-heptose 1,7-bisphosphate 7-phosphatase [Sulfuriflexus mobilis]
MRLVILDRDGVINEDSDEFIKSPDEWIPIPGSLEAIAQLSNAGWRVVVASNQSGLSRKLFDIDTLNAIHDKMYSMVNEYGGVIDAVFFCPHAPKDHCDCRKPKPGMLEQISQRLRIELNGVPVIGDSLRDLQAAQAVNAQPVLVRTGKGTETLYKGEGLEGVPVYCDLKQAANALLADKLLENI